MASSLRTKLRIAGTVLGCRGFFDAWLGRVLWQPVPPPPPSISGKAGTVEPADGPSGTSVPPQAETHGGRGGIKALRGALHVHTCTYSDGAGTMEEVMEAAKRAGVDFVLLTDHNTMRPKADGWEEKYAGQIPFLIVGDEITVEGGAFLLALDLPGSFEFPVHRPSQEAIDAVTAVGGLPLVSLPFDMKHPWEDWEANGCEGLEVLNLSTVAREQINALSLLFWLLPLWKLKGELAVIQALCARPDASFARWDKLLATGRKYIGLGALDAHALMKILGKKYPIPNYENSFKAVSTWVLTADRTQAAVHAAIRQGRCYFSYDCLGDADGMKFLAVPPRPRLFPAPPGRRCQKTARVKSLQAPLSRGTRIRRGRGGHL
ncbi:MAG: PHP domain-containing protein [Armatimonas sp.]